ncbi:adhesion G protein-coupled receptor L2-like [Amphiura filiformis]|uniref:adhesion G protein-coupled receptor L2-like n=1 Tax=Amphiura filiformis TaxID=82378 RepID=UPI003B20BDF6
MFCFCLVVFCVNVLILSMPASGSTIQGCDDIICFNGGTCVSSNISAFDGRNWTCQCPNTHFGDICQHENICLSHPDIWCVNGTCAEISGRDFKCECDFGYEGLRCSNYNPCVSDPCDHGNTCEFLWDNNYRCKCNNPGYYGQFCDMYNNCTINPCHEGECVHLGDRNFTCNCETENTGYYGEMCEFYNPCYKTNQCQNNGNCTYSGEGETTECICPQGYGGPVCQFVDLCDRDRPCLNHGTCTPLIKEPPEYECHCQRGYLGQNCEIAVRCPADITVDIRGFIQWPMTLVHRQISMDCQFGGKANRTCAPDARRPNKPRWKYPDTSTCQPVNITRALAKEFTAYLKNITRNAFDMIEEELESSTELLLAVAKYTYDDLNFAKDVMDCVSNLLYVNKSIMRSSSYQHGTNVQLLQLLDKYKDSAEISEDSVSLDLNREHLNIYIKETRFQDLTQGIDYTHENGSIYVPGEAMGIPDGENRKRVSFISLNRDTFFIEAENSTDNDSMKTLAKDCSDVIVTDRGVISADVVDTTVAGLTNPVVVNFRIPKANCPFVCVFWNESSQLWETGGISKLSQNNSFVSCESDHLTYFSIILDPHYSQAPSAKHQKILSIISYVGCSITILSLILTIFTYVLFKNARDVKDNHDKQVLPFVFIVSCFFTRMGDHLTFGHPVNAL